MSDNAEQNEEAKSSTTASVLWRIGSSPWSLFLSTSVLSGWLLATSFVPQSPPSSLNRTVQGGNWQILRMFDAHNFASSWLTWFLAATVLLCTIGLTIKKINRTNMLGCAGVTLAVLSFALHHDHTTRIRIIVPEQMAQNGGGAPAQFIDHGTEFVSKGLKKVRLPFSIACEPEQSEGVPCWIRTATQTPVRALIPSVGSGSVQIDTVQLAWVGTRSASQDRILTFAEKNESAIPIRVGRSSADGVVFTDTLFQAKRTNEDRSTSLQMATIPTGGVVLFGKSGTNIIGVDSRVNFSAVNRLKRTPNAPAVTSITPLRRLEFAGSIKATSGASIRQQRVVPALLVLAVIFIMLSIGVTPQREEDA